MITAEGRTYNYDVENSLTSVVEGSNTILAMTYDADATLRTWQGSAGQKTHYVTPDYKVN
ncbi:MAG: hypothetical protein M0T85_16090 [Dehalococcoidales bacterium]|nr:hypothetical protein [Dehalococcoidales bacterium]